MTYKWLVRDPWAVHYRGENKSIAQAIFLSCMRRFKATRITLCECVNGVDIVRYDTDEKRYRGMSAGEWEVLFKMELE